MPRRVTEVLPEAVLQNKPEKRVTEVLVEVVRSVADQPSGGEDDDPIVMVVT